MYSVRFEAPDGPRGVGSSSKGLLCEVGFGVSNRSMGETLSEEAWKSSGGVKVALVASREVIVSSLTVKGTSTKSALGVRSELETTLPRLLVRIISVPSFEPR